MTAMHRVQQRTRYIYTSEYKKELARTRFGNNIANHMAYIFSCILYDKFNLSFKQVINFMGKIEDLKMKWQDDDNNEVTGESLLIYCIKKKVDVVAFVKSIPMSQKLYMADIGKGRAVLGADRNIESAFIATLLITVPVLKETYRFSNKKLEEFMQWVAYFIDSYWRKQPGCKEHYLSDAVIREIFIEEEGWDIVKGEKVG